MPADRALASAAPAALSSWHEGERKLQSRAGSAAQLEQLGPRIMRERMPAQHREFFARLPFLIAGSVDAAGQPWASVLAAAPGFIRTPDERHLRIDALPAREDPLAAALAPGAPIGLLGIEPPTRRRNRANGLVRRVDAEGFLVEVQQSFGNCPKYIWPRAPQMAASAAPAPAAQLSSGLDAAARRLIRAADTFFIASAHPLAGDGIASHGVDVSHRGGPPGFVHLEGEAGLLVPDFVGNSFFNTLGNIEADPRAGLLFIDFRTGDLLQLAVQAEVLWEGPELAQFEAAERLLRMQVLACLHRPAALPLRWSVQVDASGSSR